MLRGLFILGLVFILGASAYFFLRDDGVLEQVTAASVEQALIDNRVPEPMAACMGERLADRLTLNQLRALQRAAPEKDESAVPLSRSEWIERFERIDDRQAVEQVVLATGACTLDLMHEGR